MVKILGRLGGVLGAAVTVVDVAARGLASANEPGAIEITTFLIGFGAAIGFVIVLVRWLRDRRRGFSPLAADLSLLQQMLAQRK